MTTLKKTRGTLSRYGEQIPLDIPAGMQGSISEIAAFRPDESFPPRWIYRVRFPGTGETRYWIRGSMLKLVERNPKIGKVVKKPNKKVKTKSRTSVPTLKGIHQ